MTRDERAARDRLHHYWDAVVGGAPAGDATADPALADTVRRLHASDDVPGPDPSFARRLRRELLGAREMAPGDRAPEVSPPAPRIVRRRPAADDGGTPAASSRPGRRRRSGSLLATAASSVAAAAVFVVFLGALFLAFRGLAGDGAGAGSPPGPTSGLGRTPTGVAAASPRPAATPVASPTPASQCPPLRSEGLGLSKQHWEERVGAPLASAPEGRPGGSGSRAPEIVSASYRAPRGAYEARFADGILFSLRYQLDEGVTLSPDEARALIGPLLPADVERVGSVEFPDGGLVRENYRSLTLAYALAARAAGQDRDCAPPDPSFRGVPIAVTYARQEGSAVSGSIDLVFFVGG